MKSRRAFHTLLASSLVVPLCAAQESSPPARVPEVRTAPIERVVHVVHDVRSDTTRVVRVSAPDEVALVTPPCFDSSEFVTPAYVVANPGEELLSWGIKRCSEASLLRALTFAYLSEAVDPSMGGPGAAFSVALYSGSTGFGQPGNEIFRRTFTGMPTLGLVQLRIDFGTEPLPLADGAFGWGYLQLDGDTGPFLVRAPKPILGTRDALDVYSPGPARAASYVGTFNYGGCQGTTNPCASTFVQVDEVLNRETARTDVLNGSGANPVLLEEVFPARLGHVWAVRVAVAAPPPFGPPYTILFGSSSGVAPVASPFGEVLIDSAQQVFPALLGEGSYAFSLPPDPALVGFRVFLQAAVLAPAAPQAFLTNSLRVRFGY